jgi:hypothetical protein
MAEATIPSPPIVMVSSTVHGQTELLDQIYGILNGLGYTVWNGAIRERETIQ